MKDNAFYSEQINKLPVLCTHNRRAAAIKRYMLTRSPLFTGMEIATTIGVYDI